MSERPILFSGPMVRAILDGRKTQTRRVVKGDAINHPQVDPRQLACPFGVPGDRLWVRETFCWPGEEELFYRADPEQEQAIAALQQKHRENPNYPKLVWTPAIYMPRCASRILLEITGVRVERLQEISEADARAEGIERVGGPTSCNPWRNYQIGNAGEMSMHCSSAARSFQTLWSTIHAADGPNGWAANPWVWVVEFKRLEKESIKENRHE